MHEAEVLYQESIAGGQIAGGVGLPRETRFHVVRLPAGWRCGRGTRGPAGRWRPNRWEQRAAQRDAGLIIGTPWTSSLHMLQCKTPESREKLNCLCQKIYHIGI